MKKIRVIARRLDPITIMLIVILLAALITMLIFGEQKDEPVKIESISINSFSELSLSLMRMVIPENRGPEKKHFLPKFDNLQTSVRSYMNNLNLGYAYHDLREMRADMSQADKAVIALKLATGLVCYSEKGKNMYSKFTV